MRHTALLRSAISSTVWYNYHACQPACHNGLNRIHCSKSWSITNGSNQHQSPLGYSHSIPSAAMAAGCGLQRIIRGEPWQSKDGQIPPSQSQDTSTPSPSFLRPQHLSSAWQPRGSQADEECRPHAAAQDQGPREEGPHH